MLLNSFLFKIIASFVKLNSEVAQNDKHIKLTASLIAPDYVLTPHKKKQRQRLLRLSLLDGTSPLLNV